jgi:hypothetical protein
MTDILDNHISGFLADFRQSQRPFTPGTEPCIVLGCNELAVTYCESCKAGLCVAHADSDTYDDVDICLDLEDCDKRCGVLLDEKRTDA